MRPDLPHLREPTQQRAIARVNLILEAARRLIATHGSAGLKIQDIAREAGVTAGSMYQYFPNKAAIIQALGQRYLDDTAQMIASALTPPPQDREDVFSFINNMFDAYYQMHLNDPVIQDIWMGSHADKTLQAIDDADTQRNTELIFAACEPLFRPAQRAEIKTAILMALKYTNTTLRVALAQEPAQAALTINFFKSLLWLALEKYLK